MITIIQILNHDFTGQKQLSNRIKQEILALKTKFKIIDEVNDARRKYPKYKIPSEIEDLIRKYNTE